MQGETKLIDHFSHKHRLKLYKETDYRKDPWSSSVCHLCGSKYAYQGTWSQFPVYGCKDCGFFIHECCANFPQELSDPFHPNHVLSLQEIAAVINSSSSDQDYIQCDACGRIKSNTNSSYVYHCPKCKFNLDLFCSQLKLNQIHEAHTPQNSHRHPLFVCSKLRLALDDEDVKHDCSFCLSGFIQGKDEIFVCLDCKNLLHKSCVLPPEIVHPFHLQHPLALLQTAPSYHYGEGPKCNACSLFSTRVFHCWQCQFSLDLHCATLLRPTNKTCESDPIKNQQCFTHPHPLIHCEIVDKDRLQICRGCGRGFRHQDSVFVCLECGILLDKSCAELPREITHSFHPFHPLKLAQFPPFTNRLGAADDFKCSVCLKCIKDFFYYVCLDCQFYVDPRCASVTGVQLVKSKFHHHPLAFLGTQQIDELGFFYCGSCDERCTNNFFECVSCQFRCHLKCYPSLPPLIKHDCHCDPLELTYARIKEMSDVDSDEEFYCHACEETRNLEDPSYYCKECRFVAHPHCVISEILRYIETDSATESSQIGKEPYGFYPPVAMPNLFEVAPVSGEVPEVQYSNPSQIAAELEKLPEVQSNPSVVLEELPEAQSNLSKAAAVLEEELPEDRSNLPEELLEDPSKIAAVSEELPGVQCNLSDQVAVAVAVAAELEELPKAQSNPSEVAAELEKLQPEVQSNVAAVSEQPPETQSNVAAVSEQPPETQSNLSKAAGVVEELPETQPNLAQKKSFLTKSGLLAFGRWIASAGKILKSKSKH